MAGRCRGYHTPLAFPPNVSQNECLSVDRDVLALHINHLSVNTSPVDDLLPSVDRSYGRAMGGISFRMDSLEDLRPPPLNHFFVPLYRYRQLQIITCLCKPGMSAADLRRYRRGRRNVGRMNPSTLDWFVKRFVLTDSRW